MTPQTSVPAERPLDETATFAPEDDRKMPPQVGRTLDPSQWRQVGGGEGTDTPVRRW